MKRVILFAFCFACLLVLGGCNSDVALSSGNYYIVGDYAELMTPYLMLDLDEKFFVLGPGSAVSYAEHGSFEIKDDKVIATSLSTTYIFKIKNANVLVLIDNGDNEFFKLPDNAEFVYSEDIR